MELFECVPNVSEGRRPEVVEALVEALAASDARLLHRTSDPDHHRTVLTLAGSAPALEQAVLALFAAVLPRIDLRQHQGVHPRMGAVDVVPFVPLRGSSLTAAAGLAVRVGREVAERFAVPVYLYEAAARLPGRRNLAEVRRGGFEALAERIHEPAWRPDFGPARLHPMAGAVAVGARDLLVAYNVVLDTNDVTIARQVAAAVREAGGGLPAVKALGVLLRSRGLAQVSMNLVDYRRTSLRPAFERVRAEAGRRGVAVVASEIVGLVPRAALAGTTPEELLLERSSPAQILEEQLAAAGFG